MCTCDKIKDLVRVLADRDAESARQPKVRQLELHALRKLLCWSRTAAGNKVVEGREKLMRAGRIPRQNLVDEQVLGLEIPVQNVLRVTVLHASDQLEQQ